MNLVAGLKKPSRRPIEANDAAAFLARQTYVRQNAAFDTLLMFTYWYSSMPLASSNASSIVIEPVELRSACFTVRRCSFDPF
jgi:hypothetical protein